MTELQRDYRFDNLKSFLIFLVVLAHTISRLYPEYFSSFLTRTVYAEVYSFHMPAFIFISGYFSRREHSEDVAARKLVENVLLPYIVFNAIYTVLTQTSFMRFCTPQWTLWYLLSLFFWKTMVRPISKIRGSLILSLAFALFIGITNADSFLSISRTICFFPIFPAGYKLSSVQLSKLLHVSKPIPIVALLLCFTGIFGLIHFPIKASVFHMSGGYSAIGLSPSQGILLRLALLCVGFICTLCMICLTPNRELPISFIGKNTLPIYLMHSGVIKLLSKLISFSNPLIVLIFAIPFSAAICVLFGNRFVMSVYAKVMHFISSIVLIREHD